jgi:prepilin-type N-terminal cleavage/methylation domain-containing protein
MPNRVTSAWLARPLQGAGPVSSGPRPGSGGFTLLELLVVLAIVSLLSMLVLPTIEIVKYRMDGSVRGAATALLSAQRLAVKRQHDVVVAFDSVNRRLRIHEDANNNGAIDALERVRYVQFQDGVRYGLGMAAALGSAEAAITFSESQGGLPAIRFIRNGSASEEGVFYLTSSRAAESADAESAPTRWARDSRAVRVDRATGRVSWFYYDPPGWKAGL